MAVVAAIFAFAAMTCFVGLCWCFCQSKDKYVALSQAHPPSLSSAMRKKSLEAREHTNDLNAPDEKDT